MYLSSISLDAKHIMEWDFVHNMWIYSAPMSVVLDVHSNNLKPCLRNMSHRDEVRHSERIEDTIYRNE
jgi:hypothetical protein